MPISIINTNQSKRYLQPLNYTLNSSNSLSLTKSSDSSANSNNSSRLNPKISCNLINKSTRNYKLYILTCFWIMICSNLYILLNIARNEKRIYNKAEMQHREEQKFQFKPINLNLKNEKSVISSSKNHSSPARAAALSSKSYLHEIMHATSKEGKILKRKQEKKINNSALIQVYCPLNLKNALPKPFFLNHFTLFIKCFNLTEKEKYRQLIAQNLPHSSKNEIFNVSTALTNSSKNLYQNLIKSSPTKTRDDNTFELKQHIINLEENHLLPSINAEKPPLKQNTFSKISGNYTRRISLLPTQTESQLNLTSSSKPISSSTLLLNNNNKQTSHLKQHKPTILVELDDDSSSTSSAPILTLKNKVPIKRHNMTSSSTASHCDENENNISSLDSLKQQLKSNINIQNLCKTNRELNDKEKSWNERLNKNNSILEAMYNIAFTFF
jgi:hypothetical protein